AAFAMGDIGVVVHTLKVTPNENMTEGIFGRRVRTPRIPVAETGLRVMVAMQAQETGFIMQITKQLAIFLDNRPGTLARVADALTEAKINIYAISTSDTVDHSVVRLIVSDYRKALHAFEERGTLVVEDDVLMIEGDNRPGSLARIAHKLADAKINIEY